MSFKPDTPFCLPDHAVISLQGPDAIAFAQAQFMNDVRALAPGQWQWDGWLSAKGRLQALFALLLSEPDRLLAIVRGGDAEALAAQWQRFVFRSKLSVRAVGEISVVGVFAAQTTPSPANALACLPLGSEPARALCLFDQPIAADAEAQRHWRLADIAQGLPWLESSQIDSWTPQMLSLDRLAAYSVKKGCYPGQEIVSRTHFLGQAKRGLVRLCSVSALAAGSEVSCNGRTLGTVVCAEQADNGWQALAVLPSDRPETLIAGGCEVQQLAFAPPPLPRGAEPR
ncbi:MAG: folate-binding protein [Xanthomonadaceae bacterium]|nr:folate-binding protein [Xanthomonadaceae bacterium]MDP2185726.1 folate-binding protein [Xanthomonadales bacterium]MDZ4115009.1 folate-binding protein [Xanthomonadaceae bacterium]MDZ4378081.1 folate-binding protein [Xanthomonadaceae bacterium]